MEAGIGSQDPRRRNQIGRRTTCPSRGQRITQSFSPNSKISFPSLGDDEGTEGRMIIEAEIGGHYIHRMYVDGGSASKILDEEHFTSAWKNFVVVRSPSPHNGITGRPGVIKLQAVLSTAHGMLKLSVEGGVITLKRSRMIPLECTMVSESKGNLPITNQIVEERIKKPADMTGVSRHIAEHRLNVREGCSSVRQKKIGQAVDRNQAIQEEVGKLVEAGIMKEAKDIKEKDKIGAKTGKNQKQTESVKKSKKSTVEFELFLEDKLTMEELMGLDKIICDLNKTPDLFQEPPQNCPKCGNPVDDTSEPSNDNTNVVNALQEPFVVKQDPGENSSQSTLQINHHCCYGCGDSLEDIFCHQCTCELCRKCAHYSYNCPPKVLIISNPKPCNQTIDELPQTLPSSHPTCYSGDKNPFTYDSTPNYVDDSPNVFNPPPQPPVYSCEICGNDARYGHYCTPQVPHEAYQCQPMNEDYYHEQNSCYDPNSFGFDQFQPPQYTILVCYDDDDEEDYTIAITPILSTDDPYNSLSMGNEHLNTILATESDEFIKYSVQNLVPNPSESEGEHKCDVPACDDSTTFFNILFDADHDFSSSDESLLNHDSLIISSSLKIDSLLDEFVDELTLLKSIPPGINETDWDPEEELHLIKRLFDSFMEKIDLSFTLDDLMLLGIEEDDYESKRDILILEELLSNDSISLPENESFHFDISSSSRPHAKPPDDNLRILNVKVMGDISEHNVPMPRLMFTQPTLVSNQDKSPNLLSHLGHKASQPSTKCPMMIYGRNTPILDVPFLHFYPF
nr:hypothetical protein [Tanacetum cinerariifolium]